jgi:RNA polymerase sigma factor (sigma-70 family)
MSQSNKNMGSVHAKFPSTHWSVVFAATAEESTVDQRKALEDLCNAYYEPIYGYARRRGSSPHDALDLTQGFFVHLLQSELLSKTDPQNGRLRTYLLKSFRHYVSNEKAKAAAMKRGGDRQQLSLDLSILEGRYNEAPHESDTPESLYERRWAVNDHPRRRWLC